MREVPPLLLCLGRGEVGLCNGALRNQTGAPGNVNNTGCCGRNEKINKLGNRSGSVNKHGDCMAGQSTNHSSSFLSISFNSYQFLINSYQFHIIIFSKLSAILSSGQDNRWSGGDFWWGDHPG
jgi:hypothetical protein